jgi:glyoxylase I family protein
MGTEKLAARTAAWRAIFPVNREIHPRCCGHFHYPERLIMQILGIDHLVIRCIDVKRMLGFYRDVLGCRLEKSREELGLYHLRAGKSLIDLLSVSKAPPAGSARNMDHFCLRIDAFDEPTLRAHFHAAGIELGDVHINFGADGDGPSFYLSDPEGNTIELKGPAQ